MNIQLEKLAKWRNASSLEERIINKIDKTSEKSVDKYKMWKKFIESDEAMSLSEILNTYELNKDLLLSALENENPEIKNSTSQNQWVSFAMSVELGEHDKWNIPQFEGILFLNFLKPFLQVAIANLNEKLSILGLKEDFKKHFHENVIEELLKGLANSLASISSRTIILELNIARVSGFLEGETSEDRFKFYNDVMLNDQEYMSSIRSEYMVLTRLLATKSYYWVTNTTDVIERIIKDMNILQKQFSKDEALGKVNYIDMGSSVSDSHKEGKTVAIINFDSGTRVVYKPRSLDIDNHFNDLINHLNSTGLRHKLRVVNTIDRGNYGWTEFIDYLSCKNNEEVESFYWRIGSYLAILYSINAVDFHHQNLIANGEYPVLVDLESLFHNNSSYTDQSAFSHAQSRIERSVLRVGLLPRKIGSKKGIEGIDLSALGAQEGQVSPHKTTVIIDRDKDTIRVVERNYPIPVSHHRPMLNNKIVNVVEYEEHTITGFKETYSYLMKNKNMFMEEMTKFADVSVRQILRGTARYSNLLRISLHPDFMRNGLDRSMILDKLWLDTKLNPNLKAVISSEQKDMYLGDIPYFTSYPGSKDLYNSKEEKITNFFKTSALEETTKKIEALSVIDCEEQVSFIRTAMLVLKETKKKKSEMPLPPSFYDREAFFKEAINIGKHLESRAIMGEQDGKGDISWIGSFVDNQREDQFKISPTNSTLYEGLAGISLFFAYLGYISKDEKFTDIAKQALVPVLNNIPTVKDIGAFGGITSYLYVLDHLSVLWKDENLLLNVLSKCEDKLEQLIPRDLNNDILTGSAGCAIILINLYKRFKTDNLLKLIKLCGDRLAENAIPLESGVGWKVEANPTPSSGFAHGAAGIVWALYEIYKVTNDEKYKVLADKGLDFEQTLYIPEKQNWADIKLDNEKFRNEDFVAWCNGASGVGLSRILILNLVNNKEFEKEALIALKTTCKHGFGNDHSLCHGDLGNLDILISASEYFNEDNKLKDEINLNSQRILHDIKNRGWKSGFEKNNESASLMMGITGIGLGLLKFYERNSVPSILKLQSPLELNINS